MAKDVVTALEKNKDTQILIIFSGTSHAYGINQEVENLYPGFKTFQKLVVGRFEVRVEELKDVKSVQKAMFSSGKKSCEAVGKVVSFEFDPVTKQAILSPELLQKIKEKSQEKLGPSGEIGKRKRGEDGKEVASPVKSNSQSRQ